MQAASVLAAGFRVGRKTRGAAANATDFERGFTSRRGCSDHA